MKILGIDPGLNNLGWAILEQTQNGSIVYYASGKITSHNSDEITIRLASLSSALAKIINQYRPEIAAIEEIFINVNPRSSITLGFARGAILSCLGQYQLPTMQFAPNTIKKTIVGNGKADKEQVMKMLKLVLPKVSFDSADEADAIAIAYTGLVFQTHHLMKPF